MSNLHVDSVIKSFGTKQILTDIFLSCYKGEIIGVLGRNGSGKSTLMKIIFGTLKAERKYVRVGNKVIHSIFDNRNKVKYLPQDSFLPNHLKLKTVINLFCNKNDALLIAENEFIKPLLNRKSSEMSSGEKRVAEIFLIIYSNSDFVLIDEPFNGVAPIIKEEIIKLIRNQSEFKGFVVTDHDYRNVFEVSTKKILLFDGGTKSINTVDDLRYWGYLPEIS
jgi:ABC-type multidrug transport system ATPase subunit